ncbi:MAG: carbon-nitrogen hydrolase family protein [Myxococcales bacterium]
MTVRVATLAYPIEAHASFEAFQKKQERLVSEACARGAQLLVFPEYASMELGSLRGGTASSAGPRALAGELEDMQGWLEAYRETYRSLAERFGVVISAPSFPERVDEGRANSFRNRVRVFGPSGVEGLSEKVMMTRFENEHWGIQAGSQQTVFENAWGWLGLSVCYDSEFPLLVRRQVEAGARVMLVPSCTDTLAGYHRVQISCRARALENQCFVVQSVTVGSAPWSVAIDENTGAAGVFGPVDRGFPSDGVLALGAIGEPGWVFADLDLERLNEVRRDGQVRNHQDWQLAGHLVGEVERVSLLR